MSVREQRAFRDIPTIQAEGSEEWVKTVNNLIDQFNFLAKNISLQSNFNGQVVTVTIPAGEEKIIPHSLGVIPKYRIILRQEGNGVISDIPSGWTSSSIKLINNGAVSVTVTILLVRE